MPGAYSSKGNFLFDLDGTLVDSSAAHARAYKLALAPDHPHLAQNFIYEDHAGRPTREVLSDLGVAKTKLAEMTREKQEFYRASLDRGEVHLFPGVTELLSRLAHMKRQLFIVTGASRISAERIVRETGLAPFLAGMIAAEDAVTGKPSPAPYLQALEKFHLMAGDCLVVEDGESGVASASAAGLDVILLHAKIKISGIPNVPTAAELLRQISA